MDKIESTSEPSPDGGGFNDWPKQARKLTNEESEKSLGQMLFLYSPDFVEYRQAKHNGKFVSLRIFWFADKTGLMAEQCEDSHKVKNWYRVGCEHEYVELSSKECCKIKLYHGGMCYHVSKCKKCGHISAYDSSG